MSARVQLVVEASDASGGILRGLASQLGGLGNIIEDITSKNISWGSVATQVTGAVIDGIKDSVKVTQEYANAVRDQALASGQSAEEASRFLQVLDDYQLTADDAKAATKALTREGLAPTVETIADLSRQYLELNTAQEKNAFVQKNLGRAGAEWLNLLNQGPDSIMKMNDSVSKMLVLNDGNLEDMEKLRLGQDAWNDAIEGGKIRVGLFVGGLVAANEKEKEQIENLKELGIITGSDLPSSFGLALAQHQALTAQMERGKAMTEAYNEIYGKHNELIETAAIDYKSLIGSIQSYQKEIDSYNKKNDELRASETELQAERAGLQSQLKELTAQGYGPASKAVQDISGKITDVNKKIGENKQALAENAKAHQEWAAQTVYSFALARAGADGSISELEGEVLVEAGQALGLFDKKTADTMRNVNRAFDSLDTTNAQETIDLLRAQLQDLVDTDWTVTVNVDAPFTGSGGAGNSGTGSDVGVQTGGTVYAGNSYMVGERGAEPFFPATNGRVIGHAEALHAMSLGGGSSGTYNFYGNVTLEIGEGDGAGLMSMR